MTDYATVEELRAQPGMDIEDKDDVLTLLLSAASSSVDNFCQRPDGFLAADTATARTFSATYGDYVKIDECVLVSSLGTRDTFDDSYTLIDVDDWVAVSGGPRNPNFNITPYTGLLATNNTELFPLSRQGSFADRRGRSHPFPVVQVTARWGYSLTVPAPVKQATIIIASRMFKRGESFWADAAANGNFGMLMYRKVIDPDVAFLLREGALIRTSYG